MENPIDIIKSEIAKLKVDVVTDVELAIARTSLGYVAQINPAWAERCKAALNAIGEV